MYVCTSTIILVMELLLGIAGFTPQNKLQSYLFGIQDSKI